MIADSVEPRAYVRATSSISNCILDVPEGTEERIDLGGAFRVGLIFSRVPRASQTTLAAVGSLTISEGTALTLGRLDLNSDQITAEELRSLEAESKPLRQSLRSTLERAIALARWRIGASGPHDPNRTTFVRISHWSIDGIRWHDFPFGIGEVRILVGPPVLQWLPQVRKSYTDLLRSGVGEPVAYNVLMEALELRQGSPRSALLVGVTALEVAVKQCIANLAPETDWLLENLQSPPVTRMLKDYLPKLRSKVKLRGDTILPPPKAVRAIIHQAIETRNSLVHRTGGLPGDFDLLEALHAIRDVLFLLEFYQGHEWAWGRMRVETRAAILKEAGPADAGR